MSRRGNIRHIPYMPACCKDEDHDAALIFCSFQWFFYMLSRQVGVISAFVSVKALDRTNFSVCQALV